MANYPYFPKSTKHLKPGEFWGIALADERWACGRVIELTPEGGVNPSRAFLAGLLDWCGKERPTSDAIAGSKCVHQCVLHIKALSEHGEGIIGFRELEKDGIEPWTMLDAQYVVRGFQFLRKMDPARDAGLPRFSYAGFNVLNVMAKRLFSVEGAASPP